MVECNLSYKKKVIALRNMIRLFTLMVIGLSYFTDFYFLALNVFLAYIPIELSFQMTSLNNKYLKLFLSFFFILFFPNVPYLATDIIHMDMLEIYNYNTNLSSTSLKVWILTLMLFLTIFVLILTGFNELLKQVNFLGQELKIDLIGRGLILLFVSFLSSLGMYVGRFSPRFHSIDFFRSPIYVLKTVFLDWSYSKIGLVFIFIVLHVGIIIGILVNNKLNSQETA